MRHFTIILLATALLMSLDMTSSYNLPQPNQSPPSFSRREALDRLVINFGGVPLVGAALVTAFAPSPSMAQAADDGQETKDKPGQQQKQPETEEEKKARIIKEKIAASKTNYRKPDGESKSPFRLLK